ncbi:MAG: JAB domain-containing protein [Desulfobacteraceae bacterium]|nr:JAB domain-containing protein [Desulfobacteraceae bacterium]MBU4001673.1 DNA repair protein RadC [Pseudomonadota bacterium]MBU4054619.1 DNA repair protein RadC [Pseudomonadota bacterium]
MSDKNPSGGDGHRGRLRDKFLASGLDGFHDYEVIELLLTLGTPRKDCKNAAKEAILQFMSLQGVMEASVESLCEVKGIGPINAFGIKLIKAVSDRYMKNRVLETDPVTNSRELFNYLCHTMRDKNQENFTALFLNAKNRIIQIKTLFTGTITASTVYPREVVRQALEYNAAALIFAHNHPSGDPAPSKEDFMITRQLVFACKLMGIVVHEHMVIGNNRFFSFADQGHILEINRDFEKFRVSERMQTP